MATLEPDTESPERSAERPVAEETIGELEVQIIDLFVRGVRVLGLPKSIGEIYGLLYVTPQPMPLDRLVARLRMSKGSASQGLKFLRNLGAVKPVYVAGDRRDHYEAQTELKMLVAGFIKGELQPHLESGTERLAQLQELLAENPAEDADFFGKRVEKLAIWRNRTSEMMKLVEDLLA